MDVDLRFWIDLTGVAEIFWIGLEGMFDCLGIFLGEFVLEEVR